MPITPKQEFYLKNDLISEISYQRDFNSRIVNLLKKLGNVQEEGATSDKKSRIAAGQSRKLNRPKNSSVSASFDNSPRDERSTALSIQTSNLARQARQSQNRNHRIQTPSDGVSSARKRMEDFSGEKLETGKKRKVPVSGKGSRLSSSSMSRKGGLSSVP
mmetsp:Transcript_4698/g.17656  ORF Transcript_4698/g.17656 Transcript_4698/m.17656 type:complete len:160 (-) Transcript_4698:514-993(-)